MGYEVILCRVGNEHLKSQLDYIIKSDRMQYAINNKNLCGMIHHKLLLAKSQMRSSFMAYYLTLDLMHLTHYITDLRWDGLRLYGTVNIIPLLDDALLLDSSLNNQINHEPLHGKTPARIMWVPRLLVKYDPVTHNMTDIMDLIGFDWTPCSIKE